MSQRIKWACALVICSFVGSVAATGQTLPNLFPFPNGSGLLETYNANDKPIDLTGPFFQSLGTNGRSCASCHRPAQGWSVSAEELKIRFELTQGLDPIFRPNDGSNCSHDIDTSTVDARRKSYSLLINKGLIRIELPVPDNAEFSVVSVVNPFSCNDPARLSMYRRPLPATNLRFLSAVMWDGRESSRRPIRKRLPSPQIRPTYWAIWSTRLWTPSAVMLRGRWHYRRNSSGP